MGRLELWQRNGLAPSPCSWLAIDMVDMQVRASGADPAGVPWGCFLARRCSAAVGVVSRPFLMLLYYLLSVTSLADVRSVDKFPRSKARSSPRSGRRRQRAVRLSSG